MNKRNLLFIGALLLFFTACTKTDNGPSVDFDISLPAGWIGYYMNQQDMVYYAQSPLENQNDSITEDILITKDQVGSVSVDQFAAALMQDMQKDPTYQLEYYSPSDSTINGASCRKWIHLQTLYLVNSTSKDTIYLNAVMTKYVFVHNSYGYLVSMSALDNSYAKYTPIFNDIISSFKFKN